MNLLSVSTLLLLGAVYICSVSADKKKPAVSFVVEGNNGTDSVETTKRVITSLAKDSNESGLRSKRQTDSSTAVVGLSIQRGLNGPDYARVKQTARRIERSVRRIRRSVDYADLQPEQIAQLARSMVVPLPHRLIHQIKLRNKRPPPRPRGKPMLASASSEVHADKIRGHHGFQPQPSHYHAYHEHQVFVPIYLPTSPAAPLYFSSASAEKHVEHPEHVEHVKHVKHVKEVEYAAPAPKTTRPPPPPPPTPRISFVTRTLETFSLINYNFTLVSRLKNEYLLDYTRSLASSGNTGYIDAQAIRANQRLIVVNPRGVTCQDVCDTTQTYGLGYGTIGICTGDFCQCDFTQWQFTRFTCPGETVFDPIRRTCNDPRNVVLCNDDPDPVSSAPTAPAATHPPQKYGKDGGYSNGGHSAGGYPDSGLNPFGHNQIDSFFNSNNPNASLAAALILAALTPASTTLISPISPAASLYSIPSTYSTIPNNNQGGGYGFPDNSLTGSQFDPHGLKSKFSPEQLQIFASLLSQSQNSNKGQSSLGNHVNDIIAQQQNKHRQDNFTPIRGLSTTGINAQYSLAPSQELFSFSHSLSPGTGTSSRFAATPIEEELPPITSTLEPGIDVHGLVPPLQNDKSLTEALQSIGSYHNNASPFTSSGHSSSTNQVVLQNAATLNQDQIARLTALAAQMAASNKYTG